MIYGFDISTVNVGIAILDDSGKSLVYSEVIKLDSKESLEQRAQIVKKTVNVLLEEYPASEVAVETPAKSFSKNQSTAHIIALLNRFNGMCCFILYEATGIVPELIEVRTARKLAGLKMQKVENPKSSAGKRKMKQQIIDHISGLFENFKYELTRAGNAVPTTADRADACIIAIAKWHLLNNPR